MSGNSVPRARDSWVGCCAPSSFADPLLRAGYLRTVPAPAGWPRVLMLNCGDSELPKVTELQSQDGT